jgi:hypothetical protein
MASQVRTISVNSFRLTPRIAMIRVDFIAGPP